MNKSKQRTSNVPEWGVALIAILFMFVILVLVLVPLFVCPTSPFAKATIETRRTVDFSEDMSDYDNYFPSYDEINTTLGVVLNEPPLTQFSPEIKKRYQL